MVAVDTVVRSVGSLMLYGRIEYDFLLSDGLSGRVCRLHATLSLGGPRRREYPREVDGGPSTIPTENGAHAKHRPTDARNRRLHPRSRGNSAIPRDWMHCVAGQPGPPPLTPEPQAVAAEDILVS